MTPLGKPVEPEVYITYARWRAFKPAIDGLVTANATDISSSSSVSTVILTLTKLPNRISWVNRTAGAQSSSTYAKRSNGYDGSSGTYAAPAFRIPNNPVIIEKLRSTHSTTRSSGRTPSEIRECAILLA